MARAFPNNDTNYLSTPASISRLDFPANSESFTICGWFTFNTSGVETALITRYPSSSAGPLLRWNGAGGLNKFSFFWVNVSLGGHEAIGGTAVFSAGTWVHVCATYDWSTRVARVYVNGTQDGTATGSSNMSANEADRWYIGRRATGTTPLNGNAAEIGMWNAVLSAEEVLALAKGTSPFDVRPASLKGYWPILGVAAPENDLTDGSNNMAVTGTLNLANHAPVGPKIPTSREIAPVAGRILTGVAPTNTVAPAISPAWPEVGRVETTTDGSWSGTPTITYTYQWQHSADGSTGWANISSATASTYRIAATYATEYVRCVVTATNAFGNASANSNVVGPTTGSPAAGQYASVVAA